MNRSESSHSTAQPAANPHKTAPVIGAFFDRDEREGDEEGRHESPVASERATNQPRRPEEGRSAVVGCARRVQVSVSL